MTHLCLNMFVVFILVLHAIFAALPPVAIAASERLLPANEEPIVKPRDKLTSFDVDLGAIGHLKLLEGPRKEGTIGHFDEIVLISQGGVATSVLRTEGRCLVDAAVGSFTSPSARDVVLTLDTGGAGGFVDLVLLTVKDNKIEILHEQEAVKGGRAEFSDRDGDGHPELVIHRLSEDMATNQVQDITDVWAFKDGKMVLISTTDKDSDKVNENDNKNDKENKPKEPATSQCE